MYFAKRVFSIFCVLIVSESVAYGQSPLAVSINSDIPGQAFTQFTINENVLQTQNGIGIRSLIYNSMVLSHIVPNTFLRFGLGHRTEINASFERIGAAGYRKNFTSPKLPIMKTMSLGLRYELNLWQNKLRKPAATVLVMANLPYAKFNTKNTVNTTATLIVRQELSKKWACNFNLGVNTDFNNPFSTSYVANFGYAIAPKWSVFAESFGSFTANKLYNYFDAGFAFVPHIDWQIDLYAGNGLGHNMYNGFINAGFSYRLNNKDTRRAH